MFFKTNQEPFSMRLLFLCNLNIYCAPHSTFLTNISVSPPTLNERFNKTWIWRESSQGALSKQIVCWRFLFSWPITHQSLLLRVLEFLFSPTESVEWFVYEFQAYGSLRSHLRIFWTKTLLFSILYQNVKLKVTQIHDKLAKRHVADLIKRMFLF